MDHRSSSVAQILQAAVVLHQQGQLAQAKALYQQVLQREPNQFDALHLLALILDLDGDPQQACALLRRAIHIAPQHAVAHANLGLMLQGRGHYPAALLSFNRALALTPQDADLFFKRGKVQQEMGHYAAALRDYDQALRLEPNRIDSLSQRGTLHLLSHQPDAASADFLRVIALQPDHLPTLNNFGLALQQLGQHTAALANFKQVLRYDPDNGHAEAQVFYEQHYLCQWDERAARGAALRARVAQGAPWQSHVPPFIFLQAETSLAEQQRCARQWADAIFGPGHTPPKSHTARRSGQRLRIGYLSADFHAHATAYLLYAVFEAHQHQQLDCFAYSYGPDDGSPMRARLQASFTAFIDVSALAPAALAQRIQADGIDILIDLKGYTSGANSALLAYRAAPIQVQFLGYPGTMGTPLVDYIIADRYLIPPQDFAYYDEQIVHLPDCYQPNSPALLVDPIPSRSAAGLPERGFVFCCFNHVYKITPPVFQQWLRVLHATPGSVLWLLEANAVAMHNLRGAAQAGGIDPARLIFAPLLAHSAHLARLTLSDLFLDTSPINAHTTASDALWVGVPVLTCPGASFAARVAASLLHTLGLPELIAETAEQYEQLACALASTPTRLAALKAKLMAARLDAPLFDAPRFAAHLELAYRMMWQRYQDGLPAAPIQVPALPARRSAPPAPDLPALLQAAVAQHQQGQLAAAKTLYQRILQHAPNNFNAMHLLGLVASGSGDLEHAAELIGHAIECEPQHAVAHANLGRILQQLNRRPEALLSLCRALAIEPDNADTFFKRGNVQQEMSQFHAAIADYQRAIELDPQHIDAHYNRGIAHWRLRDMELALADYALTLQLKPDHVGALNNQGVALQQIGQNAAALRSFEEVLQYQPEHGHAASKALHQRQYLCQWDGLEARSAALREAVLHHAPLATGIAPFILLTLDTSAAEQQRCARQWAARKVLTEAGEAALPQREPQQRAAGRPLHIAYLSSDLHQHATAQLMIGVFAAHQRQAIVCSAYSFGLDDASPMRARLQASFSHFHDVSALSASAIAQQIHADGVDILIDLKGYTNDNKSEILAYRAAPIQVQFLGYPGTMGTPLVDYLIADQFVIPPEHFAYYDERIVHLPHCYQPNDPQRVIGPVPSRLEAGLPASGFVFCCFNQSYKITPTVFSQWMRLLQATPGSVLWLLMGQEETVLNLRREAGLRGVEGQRLIFAPNLPQEAHLGRLTLADLFLDTTPVNAHTTASDALWAGVPVLTCPGQTFASRVAGSVLHSMGLSELITDSAAAYEALAYALATQPERLARLKQKIAAARLSSPLFDAQGFATHLETAYHMMWQRYASGAAAAAITVP